MSSSFITVLPSASIFVREQYIGTFQFIPFIAAGVTIQQSSTHCSDDEEGNKKNDDTIPASSSFVNNRNDHSLSSHFPHPAIKETPDAASFYIQKEATPSFSISNFGSSINNNTPNTPDFAGQFMRTSAINATPSLSISNFGSSINYNRNTPDFAGQFMRTSNTNQKTPNFNTHPQQEHMTTNDNSQPKLATRGKTPDGNEFLYKQKATPSFSASNFSSSMNNSEEKTTPDVAEFLKPSTAIKQTPCFNTNTFEEDEVDTSDFESKLRRASADTNMHRELYYNIGETFFNALYQLKQKSSSNVDRLPLLSLACATKKLSRKEFMTILGQNISKYEWAKAKAHAKFPGPGHPVPVKLKYRRKRFEDAVIQEFLEWLHSHDFLQNLSFGQKVVRLENGVHTAIEAVKLTSSQTKIIQEYSNTFVENFSSSSDESSTGNDDEIHYTNLADHERCEALCPKSKVQCFKEKDHDGRHGYTPKGCLSPSSLARLLSLLSSGQIKSLAGLDDTHCRCGRDNFIKMRAMVENLVNVANLDRNGDRKDLLIQKINKAEEFYKVHFGMHLGQKGSDPSHICTCFECGFHSEDHPTECKHRGKHKGLCKECMDSFHIFEDLYDLHEEAQKIATEEKLLDRYPTLQDDFPLWLRQIDSFYRNFLHYRAHVAQIEDEAIYDRNFYDKIKEGECILVMDYKMKINASLFREAQADWFGKRGFSLLGALILIPSDNPDNYKAHYHFFLSDDTTQDAQYVNTVKEYIYKYIMPKYNIKKVHFRCDGAGCFVSSAIKEEMSQWDHRTGIFEATYKNNVPGQGKGPLDGQFGIQSQAINGAVNEGHSFETAEQLYEICKEYRLENTFYYLLDLKRDKVNFSKESDKPIKDLKLGRRHYLLRNEKEEVIGHTHSRHGKGESIPLLKAKKGSVEFDVYSMSIPKLNSKLRTNGLQRYLQKEDTEKRKRLIQKLKTDIGSSDVDASSASNSEDSISSSDHDSSSDDDSVSFSDDEDESCSGDKRKISIEKIQSNKKSKRNYNKESDPDSRVTNRKKKNSKCQEGIQSDNSEVDVKKKKRKMPKVAEKPSNLNKGSVEYYDPAIHISKTTCTENSLTGKFSIVNRPGTHNERVNEKKTACVQTKNKILKSKEQEKIEELVKYGVHHCDVTDSSGNRCQAGPYSSKLHLANHKKCDVHKFPKANLCGKALQDCTSGKYAFCLALGSMTNRDRSLATEVEVRDADKDRPSSKKMKAIFDSYDTPGSYRRDCKGWDIPNFKAAPELTKDLLRLFIEGEDRSSDGNKRNAQKYKPAEAAAILYNMRSQDGRRKYRDNGEFGRLPDNPEVYIQRKFAEWAKKGGKAVLEKIEQAEKDPLRHMTVPELKAKYVEVFDEDFSYKNALIKSLQLDDTIMYGGIDDVDLYSGLSVQDLERDVLERFEEKNCSTQKKLLCTLLKLHESVNAMTPTDLQIARQLSEIAILSFNHENNSESND